jgi:hypothetical protein
MAHGYIPVLWSKEAISRWRIVRPLVNAITNLTLWLTFCLIVPYLLLASDLPFFKFLRIVICAIIVLQIARRFIAHNRKTFVHGFTSSIPRAVPKSAKVVVPLVLLLIPPLLIHHEISSLVESGIDCIDNQLKKNETVPFPKVIFVERNYGSWFHSVNPSYYLSLWLPEPFSWPLKYKIEFSVARLDITPLTRWAFIAFSILKVWLKVFQILLLVGALYLTIKLFLYALVRIMSANGAALLFSVPIGLKPAPKSSIYIRGAQVHGRDLPSKRLYVRCDRQPVGSVPRISLPNPSDAFIARILHGFYIVNQYDNSLKSPPIEFLNARGRVYVEWRLRPNEYIVFNYHNLVAWSSNVRIKTFISFSITGFALNRTFVPIAVGPGSVLLECGGQPKCSGPQEEPTTSTIDHLAAWAGEEFVIAGSGRVADIYLGSCSLKAKSLGSTIIDPESSAVSQRNFILSSLRKLYMPF